MSNELSVDLGEIEAFAGRLDTLRADLDLTGQSVPEQTGPQRLAYPETLNDVVSGLEDFIRAKNAAAAAVDTYLSAMATMAHQSVVKLREADDALAKALPPSPVVHHRDYAM